MKNSNWILYQSNKWPNEEINWATLCDNRLKDTKVTG